MSLTAPAQLGERSVTVRELTMTEVRQWVSRAELGTPVDPLRRMMFEDCSLDDLALMCDCPVGDLEGHTESELTALRDVCRTVNPYFFRVRAAMDSVARYLDPSSLLPTSTEASPSSP